MLQEPHISRAPLISANSDTAPTAACLNPINHGLRQLPQTPSMSAESNGDSRELIFAFVIPALAPALTAASSYSVLQRNMFPGRSSCAFCRGQKAHGMTRLIATQIFFQIFFFQKYNVFIRTNTYSGGLIKPAAQAPCDGSSAQLPHDISGTDQELSMLCCPTDECERDISSIPGW